MKTKRNGRVSQAAVVCELGVSVQGRNGLLTKMLL